MSMTASRRKRQHMLLTLGVAVVAITALPTARADAIYREWSCDGRGSGVPCGYYVAPQYYPWLYVGNRTDRVAGEVCAKAKTAADNVRSGSGCDYNVNSRASYMSSAYPESFAYIYWAGPGGPLGLFGDANTTG
jgi:hypothetical protein